MESTSLNLVGIEPAGLSLSMWNQISDRSPGLGNNNDLAFFDSIQEIVTLVLELVVINFYVHAYSLIGESKANRLRA